MIPSSCVYQGHVYHKRLRPAVHAFRYAVFSVFLDIDKIEEITKHLFLFSSNKWNFFSLYERDFDSADSSDLRSYVEHHLQQQNIERKPANIHLLCYPRILGYSFNPLSVFYCWDERGRLFAVLHQVRNTFGERELYVLPVKSLQQAAQAQSDGLATPGLTKKNQMITQVCFKSMHVSPFTPMSMQYDFRLNRPGETLFLNINASDPDGLMLSASINGKRKALSDLLLLKFFLLYPLMTVKVIAGIHWEALRLWLKRVPWFSHQPKKSPISPNSDAGEIEK